MWGLVWNILILCNQLILVGSGYFLPVKNWINHNNGPCLQRFMEIRPAHISWSQFCSSYAPRSTLFHPLINVDFQSTTDQVGYPIGILYQAYFFTVSTSVPIFFFQKSTFSYLERLIRLLLLFKNSVVVFFFQNLNTAHENGFTELHSPTGTQWTYCH